MIEPSILRHGKSLLVLALTVLLLTGCGRDRSDLEQWVAETLQRPPEPIEPIPTVRTPDVIAYEAGNLPDPFLSNMRDPDGQAEQGLAGGPQTGPRPDLNRRREFLEQYPLDTLAMVGSIEISDTAFALVSDFDGTIHRVQAGNYMGQNHGRILNISESSIELLELVPDGTSGWMEREAQIALSDNRPQQR
ncbi:MAG: pilus assembly protein PilP [Pseudomonadota bacterium]